MSTEPAYAANGRGSGHLALLSAPGAPRLVVWSLAGRFGFADSNLALPTYVHVVTGSFGFAGSVMALSLIGLLQSRPVDRFGCEVRSLYSVARTPWRVPSWSWS